MERRGRGERQGLMEGSRERIKRRTRARPVPESNGLF